MPYEQAKFCLDLNQTRWTLLGGVITRKTQEDPPEGGKRLEVERITAVEDFSFTRVHRTPLAWPATVAGAVLAALFGGLAAVIHWIFAPPAVLGLVCLIWGIRNLPAKTEPVGGYQIVARETAPEEWRVAGSHHEVRGFIEGLRAELAAKEAAPPPAPSGRVN